MKIKARHDAIVEIVRRNGQASVEELAGALDISRETIRRDLTRLASAGRVHKVHGGATLPSGFGEGSFHNRMSAHTQAKVKIARAAALLIAAGETVFIDTGTTTLFFAEALAGVRGLTVVTNSTEIARTVLMADNGGKAFLVGGEFALDNRQTIGAMAGDQIRLFRAHHAVLTCGALDSQSGVMDFNIEEARIARAMTGQAKSLTVLADCSKFDDLASFEVCPLEQISRLVCDKAPGGALAGALDSAGVDVIVAR